MPWWLVASPLALLAVVVWLRWQPKGPLRLSAAIEVAMRCAVRGDLHECARWHAEARRWYARARGPSRATADARLLLVDVVVQCRREQLEDAWSALHRRWMLFEPTGGSGIDEACLLRGYLAWRTERDVEPWLGLMSPGGASRVIWMASEWQELAAFCDAHGLRS